MLTAAALCLCHPALAQGTVGLGAKLDSAEKKLDEDIKACRQIDVDEYRKLLTEANRNLDILTKAAGSGAPVDTEQFKADHKRAQALLGRAKAAASKPCPPPQQQPQTAPPPKENETPKQAEPPKIQPLNEGWKLNRTPFQEFEDDADDLMDDLWDAMDDCDQDEINKLIPRLEEMAKKAHELAKAAKAAGEFGTIDPKYAEGLAKELDWAVIAAKNFKCPKNKKPRIKLVPEQPRQTTPAPQPKEEPKVPGVAPAPQKTGLEEYNDIKNSLPGVVLALRNDSTNCALYRFWEADIARLEGLARRARALAAAAKAAGPYSKVDAGEAEKLARQAEDELANAKKNPPPKCPGKTSEQPTLPVTPENKKGASYQLDPFASRILYLHNAERAAVGVPPLRWNPALAAAAVIWASQMAMSHQLIHAPREGRGIERENLLQALPSWSVDRMMGSWTFEKRDFRAGYYPDVALDGNWMSVSHYTQIIWPTTTDIGCGMAKGGGYLWLDCRYSPGGNKDGKPVGLFAGVESQYGGHGPAITSCKSAPEFQTEGRTCAEGEKPKLYKWIDTKTGETVPSFPVITDPKSGKTEWIAPDATDHDRAFDQRTGRNLEKVDGKWFDTKTGERIYDFPVITDPKSGKTEWIAPDATDHDRAFDQRTGRNLIRVPVEPEPRIPERG